MASNVKILTADKNRLQQIGDSRVTNFLDPPNVHLGHYQVSTVLQDDHFRAHYRCAEIFPVLDKQILEVICSLAHLAALLQFMEMKLEDP